MTIKSIKDSALANKVESPRWQPPTKAAEPSLLTAAVVADYLNISTEMVEQIIKSGDLKAFRVGDQIRIASIHVMDYLYR